jgi:hypothetical protein
MGIPTRYSQGVSTQFKGTLLGDYPLPSPFRTSSTPTTSTINGYTVASYSNDFNKVDAGWSETAGTWATTDFAGGAAVLTPSTSGTTANARQTSAGWQFIAGQKLWYQTAIAVSSVASGVQIVYAGLINSSGGTISTNNSLMFVKPAGVTYLNLVATVGGTSTTLVTNVASLTSGTMVNLGLYFNGTDLLVYVADALVARVAAPVLGTTLPNDLLTPIFEITPVTTETITVDYVLVAQELSR